METQISSIGAISPLTRVREALERNATAGHITQYEARFIESPLFVMRFRLKRQLRAFDLIIEQTQALSTALGKYHIFHVCAEVYGASIR